MKTQSALFLVGAWVALGIWLMAHDFGTLVAAGGSPITPEQYGPEVYAIAALVWVAAQQYAASLAILGCVIVAAEGRWRRTGAFIAGVGWTALASLFLLFAFLSKDQPQAALLHACAKFPGTMTCSLFAVLAGRAFFWGDEE